MTHQQAPLARRRVRFDAPRKGARFHDFCLEALATPTGTMWLVTDAEARVRALDWEEARMRTLLGRLYGPTLRLTAGRAPATIRDAVHAYFAGNLRALDALLSSAPGTEFQKLVWSALRDIQAGSTFSYEQLAQRIGRPRAVRAVGLANGQNPISIVVPCHRVIGKSGALTGYGGGLTRKRWLLRHEGVLS